MTVFKRWRAAALLVGATGLYPNIIPLVPFEGSPPDAYAPEPTPLRGSTPGPGESFGAALAGSNLRLVVGAPGTGTAYVFSPGSAVPASLLHDPSAASGNDFGAAVAASGGALAVGAPGSAAASGGGAVHVFDPGGVFRRTLVDPAETAGDRFGTAIAITASERLLVGAPAVVTGRSGAAYIFSPSGQLLVTLGSPNPTPGDGFGSTVAVVGSTALVAAPFDDTAATDAGAVYVFDVLPTSPSYGALLRRLQKPTPAIGDGFGIALAATSDTIFVGVPFDDAVAPDAGAVHLFEADDGTSLGALQAPSLHSGDGFGTALAALEFSLPAVGALLAVGAPGDDTAVVEGGAVHLFVHPADAISGVRPSRILTRAGAAAFDAFGYALAFSGEALGVGIPGDAGTAGAALRYLPTCGNGDVEADEQCDDDNNSDGDGCSALCHTESCICSPDGCGGQEVSVPTVRSLTPVALTSAPECNCGATTGDDCSGTGDGLSCTANERCTGEAGLCMGTSLNHGLCEDDGNPCTIARCDAAGPPPTGCVHDQISCDDADPCTDDTCDVIAGGCLHTPRDCTCDADADCNDGHTCNGNERCFECPLCRVSNRFGCCSGPATCSGGTPPPLASPCNDANACTANDRCDTQLRCTGESLPGNAFVTIGCVLQQAPCPETVPTKRLRRLHARALALVQRAVTNPTDTLIRKAIAKITRALAAARDAGARGKLPPECVELWIALLDEALALLQTASG